MTKKYNRKATLIGVVIMFSMIHLNIGYANEVSEINNYSPTLINDENTGIDSVVDSNVGNGTEKNNLNQIQTPINNEGVNNGNMNTIVNDSSNNSNSGVNHITNGNVNNSLNHSIIGNNQVTSSGGSLGKAEDYVGRKLFDVVGFFQAIIRPLVYLTFIISVISVLFGVVTSSKSKFYGFIGMAVSVFAYVAVILAPQIVDYFSAWLSM